MQIALVEPEIPFNTGNIGRTCVATGTPLHLVGRLGFSLDSKYLKRSGLDYWPKLKLAIHADLDSFLAALPKDASLLFFSTHARRSFWDAPYQEDTCLVFGKESAGLPAAVRRRFRDRLYRLPMSRGVRSLNLSTAAGIALYEGLRRFRRGLPPTSNSVQSRP